MVINGQKPTREKHAFCLQKRKELQPLEVAGLLYDALQEIKVLQGKVSMFEAVQRKQQQIVETPVVEAELKKQEIKVLRSKVSTFEAVQRKQQQVVDVPVIEAEPEKEETEPKKPTSKKKVSKKKDTDK